MKKRVHLTFPGELIQEPVIYDLNRAFNVVTNIRRANVEDTHGWMILEVEGDDDAVQAGIDYLTERGIEVAPIDGDVVQG
jgi:L-aspartate semialdehyde sulfurtransferase ferredoxin